MNDKLNTCVITLKLQVVTRSVEVIRFSTARTTPSLVFKPIAVEPNCLNNKQQTTIISLM